MKKLWIILLMIGIHQMTAKAQDLIVTFDGDSLNCKITQIKNDYVYFIFKYQNEERKTLLPKEQIEYYQYNYYSTGENYSYQRKKDFPRFRVGVAGGYSFRTFGSSDGSRELKNYESQMRHGFNYGVEFNYFFNRFLGMGINYYCSRHNPAGSCPVFYPDRVSTKTRIQQVMPTFNVRFLDKKRQGGFFMGIGIGYVDYRTKYCLINRNDLHIGTEKGWTLGMQWFLGYDIPVSKTLAIFVQAWLSSGVVTNITFKDELTGETTTASTDDANNGVGLGKINLSLGLRFAK
jgi:hypothetical protein